MKDVFIAAWNVFESFAELNRDSVVLDDKKDEFVESCCDIYNQFICRYMKTDLTHNNETEKVFDNQLKLDRHKIGAIISIVGSRGYFKSKNKNDTCNIFIGQYTIPISVGLQLILDDINRDLKEFGFLNRKKTSIELYIPEAKVCETNYIVSLARNFIFEEQNKVDVLLRVMELANVFFLMEECTLLFEKVPMKEWLMFKRNQRI